MNPPMIRPQKPTESIKGNFFKGRGRRNILHELFDKLSFTISSVSALSIAYMSHTVEYLPPFTLPNNARDKVS
jgi:hypothetical protein